MQNTASHQATQNTSTDKGCAQSSASTGVGTAGHIAPKITGAERAHCTFAAAPKLTGDYSPDELLIDAYDAHTRRIATLGEMTERRHAAMYRDTLTLAIAFTLFTSMLASYFH